MMNFDDKYAGETEYVGWDFAARLETGETLTSAAFTSDPAGILQGAAQIGGAIARQLVADLVAGTRYTMVVTAQTSGGRTLIEAGVLRARATT
ncbi:MAG: hypothetical protein Q8O34_00705 [Rhodocyclaceae bacterium]|nr:hypothetical protein [Rhodocyclaceae bacterium]